jgi:hypothetical protein
MRRTAVVLLVTAFVVQAAVHAQSAHTLEQLVDRMGSYLLDYETRLSSVVADELFQQKVDNERQLNSVDAGDLLPESVGTSRTSQRGERVTLESEIAFMRLPGGAQWLGFRDVRKVNSKPVSAPGPIISEVLKSSAGDVAKAQSIADASARYNLGLPRTVNVPTAPLEIIHPARRDAFKYERLDDDRVRGTRTTVLRFTELQRPTIMREPTGRELVSSGRIWIEPGTGTVWRVEWIYQADRGAGATFPPQLRVDFTPHAELGIMVPMTMTEVFSTPAGRGEGRATYTNFRRFATGARIVPQ